MKRVLVALAAGLVLAACQEKLTQPADCPALCPSGQTQVLDTVLLPEYGLDSTFPGPDQGGPAEGYVGRGRGSAILISNNLPGADYRAVLRFASRPDTLIVKDTARTYSVDSAALVVPISGRDTTLSGATLQFYLIDSTQADTAATWAGITQAIAARTPLATVPIPDSLTTGILRYVFTPAELDRFRDSTSLALAVALTAPQPTGVRITSVGNTTAPQFVSYLHINIADTLYQSRIDSRPLLVGTWVSAVPPSLPDSQYLAVGGTPSRRVALRFKVPAQLRDTATIVRATLELVPAEPVRGVPNDPALVEAVGVLTDLGAKSPQLSSSALNPAIDTVHAGETAPISLDVGPLVRLWKQFSTLPTSIFLVLQPEGASFTEPLFYGTRSEPPGTTPQASQLQPRLHITYTLPFNFGAK